MHLKLHYDQCAMENRNSASLQIIRDKLLAITDKTKEALTELTHIISSDGLELLFEHFTEFPKLKFIRLDRITNGSINIPVSIPILQISVERLGIKEANILLSKLQMFDSVQELMLYGSHLESHIIASLFEALRCNMNSKRLSINSQEFKNGSFAMISKLLIHNTSSLVRLFIGSPNMYDLESIKHSLVYHPKLQELEMILDTVSPTVSETIKDILKFNKILNCLTIQIGVIEDIDLFENRLNFIIKEGLLYNSTLSEIYFHTFQDNNNPQCLQFQHRIKKLFSSVISKLIQVNPKLALMVSNQLQLYQEIPKVMILATEDYKIQTMSAIDLFYHRKLLLLFSIFPADLVLHMKSLLLYTFSVDKPQLKAVLLNRSSIGSIKNFATLPFDGNELIKCCYRWLKSNK
ncbi:hypothetical protein HDV02_003404 [Globomyces sp. JEL0801]|nr:hypothetical protein HDV02_003404 [Globomyces sp. JEL0801]